MRGLGVRAQLLLVLLVPLAIFGPLTVLVVHEALRRSVAGEVDARADILARQTASVLVDDVLTGDRIGAERRLADIRDANGDLAYLFVVDVRGQVVAHTFPMGFPVDLLAVHDVAAPAPRPRAVALDGRRLRDVSAPVLGGTAGWVHLGISMDTLRLAPAWAMARLAGVGSGLVVVGAGLALVFASRTLRRFEKVFAAAESIGAGRFDIALRDDRDDEIGELCRAMDEMAVRLREARDERERTAQRLAQSERLVAVGRLAAGVAHEINNPLSGVRHCLDNLRRDDGDERGRREYYALMEDGVARAQRVIRGLLDFSRQQPLDVQPVDVARLVEQVRELAGPALRKNNVRVVVAHRDELPPLALDPHQMAQVLLNLLLNASEAMPHGGVVTVETSLCEGHCLIRVRDAGRGIAPADLERIFEPFFTTKGKAQGSGLGLSVSLGIVERHNGKITVSSEVGRGTTFDVLLPRPEARRG